MKKEILELKNQRKQTSKFYRDKDKENDRIRGNKTFSEGREGILQSEDPELEDKKIFNYLESLNWNLEEI